MRTEPFSEGSRGALFLALTILPLAFVIRTDFARRAPDPFRPDPDALEYAAGAQSLAQTGRYFLQVGPQRAQPRYPPGWSLLLAPAVRMGLAGERLWMVTAFFGALNAWLVALAASAATRVWLTRAGPARGQPARAGMGPLVAGVVAGVGWSLAAASLHSDTSIMSDEANAFFLNAGLVALAIGLAEGEGGVRTRLLMMAGGAFMGMSLVLRISSLPLLLAPLAVFLVGAAVRRGGRAAARATAWIAAGLALPAAGAAIVMWRSGYAPWCWSAYGPWQPMGTGLGELFSLRFALYGHPDVVGHTGGVRTGNLELAARLLLGLGGIAEPALARWWPALAAAGAAAILSRPPGRLVPELRLAAAAVAALLAAHVAVFSLYFFPGVRFYLAALAWSCVAIGFVVGVLWEGQGRLRLVLAASLAAGTGVLTHAEARPLLRPQFRPVLDHDTRNGVRAWLALSDEQRRQMTIPFDPVRAQALGLLGPEALSGIGEWGELPPAYRTTAYSVSR